MDLLMFQILLLYTICAATFTLSKAALFYADPFFCIGFRMLIAGIFLLGWSFFTGTFKKPVKRDWPLLAQVALFSICIAYMGDLWSLQYLMSSESALIFNLSPFAAAFFSYVWFKEKMTTKKWIGFCIGFCSIIPLVCKDACFSFTHITARLLPIAVLIISVISSAYGWIVIRELVKNRAYSSAFVNGFSMCIGGMIALLFSWTFESWTPSPVVSWEKFLILIGATILVANIVFSNFYTILLKHYTATLLSFSGLICPLIVTFFGWIFLGEALTLTIVLSAFCASFGIAIFYHEELIQGYVKK